MIHGGNPFVNVDDLMAKINDQIATRGGMARIDGDHARSTLSELTTLAAGIEADLDAAEAAAQVRTTLGRQRRLPGGAVVQAVLLRALAFIFRDQRAVNAALIGALRRSLQLNVVLAEDVERLRQSVAAADDASTR